jgi:hypothetical protein
MTPTAAAYREADSRASRFFFRPRRRNGIKSATIAIVMTLRRRAGFLRPALGRRPSAQLPDEDVDAAG